MTRDVRRGLPVAADLLGASAPMQPSNPLWPVTGVTGIPRERGWDVVASGRAPGLPSDEVHFVAVPDGSLIVDEYVPDGSLAPLAEAVENTVAPPYRAHGVRRSNDVWAVGAIRIDVVELPPELHGDLLELIVRGGQRTLHVDGRPSFVDLPELARLARGASEYVVRARRLDERLWEAEGHPL